MKELKFTDNIIINSSEIQNWLEQFNKDKLDKEIAIKILKQLRFFTISDFNIFIKQSLTDLVRKISKDRIKLPIYPIIKLTNESEKIWEVDNKGNFSIVGRSSKGKGSEDLVINAIHDLCKSNESPFLESPDTRELSVNKVRNIIFVVDNSISGDQVNHYLNAFFDNKTIKSYWSLNYFKITILSFYISERAKDKIKTNKFIANKFKKGPSCVSFEYFVSERGWEDYQIIKELLDRYTVIPKKYRFGYDESAGDVIFEYSIPNNVFGIFYYKAGNKWKPLFENRRVSNELIKMLNNENIDSYSEIPKDHLRVLHLIYNKKNTLSKISISVGVSEEYIKIICDWLIKIKFIDLTNIKKFYRLTESGKNYLTKHNVTPDKIDNFNFEIYTPKNMERHKLPLFTKKRNGENFSF
ncbi:hypothetical protein A6B40_03065 [Mannheimia varigena]|uniref:phosphoribosyltransferase-like protein n=1 Tax=Mannheimia varigena TaxID=85404 RepID=UPI00159E2950|nr:hypothetical protein [Mannheimia varigena]QLB16639.1 hypothetical protein A6B40_03065 [Mannheimia varigena]